MLTLGNAFNESSLIHYLNQIAIHLVFRTDEMIQQTIRRKFDDSTVITIAHRLYTVIDSDRILVMESGVAVEFDKPYLLMQNKNSVFRKMVEALGPQEYDRLYSIAVQNKKYS